MNPDRTSGSGRGAIIAEVLRWLDRQMLQSDNPATVEVLQRLLSKAVALSMQEVWPDAEPVGDNRFVFRSDSYELRVGFPITSRSTIEVGLIPTNMFGDAQIPPGTESPLSGCGALTELRLFPPIADLAFHFDIFVLRETIAAVLHRLKEWWDQTQFLHLHDELHQIFPLLGLPVLQAGEQRSTGLATPPLHLAVGDGFSIWLDPAIAAADLLSTTCRGGLLVTSALLDRLDQVGQAALKRSSGADTHWSFSLDQGPNDELSASFPLLNAAEVHSEIILKGDVCRVFELCDAARPSDPLSERREVRTNLDAQVKIDNLLYQVRSYVDTNPLTSDVRDFGRLVHSVSS
jgi:hypothetical protein